MTPYIELITREIPAKGKGYIVVRRCPAEELEEALRRSAARLLGQGASTLYVCSLDPAAPLTEAMGLGYRLDWRHDMLGMTRTLADRPAGSGRLTLEPLTRERGGTWLALYNESFFDVPNSETYDQKTLEQFLDGPYRCGFALLDGVPVGIYETGFKKENPEIGSIGLAKSARGKGLGRELLLTVLELLAGLGCEKCWLQVSTANQTAFPLYRDVGFKAEQVPSRWYELTALEDLMAERV